MRLLPEALGRLSLFFRGMESLALASLCSRVETGGEGAGVPLTVGQVGGVGFRLGGSLQMVGDRSSSSLVVWEASGSQLKASGASARSAVLLLLDVLLL